MRIAFTVYDRPNYAAGPIVNIRRLLPELKRQGHEPCAMVLYSGGEAPNAEALKSQGIECRMAAREPGYSEQQALWLIKQVADFRPDVFIPNVSVPAYYAARWIRAGGSKAIGMVRSNDDFYRGILNLFGTGDWAMDAFVCVDNFLNNMAAELCGNIMPLRTIVSGVPLPDQTASQDGPLKLVYVGRLEEQQKQITAVTAALCRAVGKHADCTATIIGDGTMKRKVENQIAKSGLSDRITLMGPVPCDEIQSRLVEYNTAVLLSDYEGTPGAVMDAMACGLVPVCLNISGGTGDLVIDGKTGLMVSDRMDGFDAAIARLAGDPALRKELAVDARTHVQSSFSLEHAADEWISFCQELTADSAPGPLEIPDHISLPPVSPSLAARDKREPGWRRFLGGLVSS